MKMSEQNNQQKLLTAEEKRIEENIECVLVQECGIDNEGFLHYGDSCKMLARYVVNHTSQQVAAALSVPQNYLQRVIEAYGNIGGYDGLLGEILTYLQRVDPSTEISNSIIEVSKGIMMDFFRRTQISSTTLERDLLRSLILDGINQHTASLREQYELMIKSKNKQFDRAEELQRKLDEQKHQFDMVSRSLADKDARIKEELEEIKRNAEKVALEWFILREVEFPKQLSEKDEIIKEVKEANLVCERYIKKQDLTIKQLKDEVDGLYVTLADTVSKGKYNEALAEKDLRIKELKDQINQQNTSHVPEGICPECGENIRSKD